MTARTLGVLRVTVGLGLLALVFGRTDLSALRSVSVANAFVSVSAAVILMLAAQAFSALRWRLVLGRSEIGWALLFRLYLTGQFFSLFLPTSVGGDAFRALALTRSGVNARDSIASVFIERLIGFIVLLVYLAVGLAASPHAVDFLQRTEISSAYWLLLLLLGTALVSAAVALRRNSARFRQFIARALIVPRRLSASPRVFSSAVAAAVVVQALYVGVWAVLSAGLDVRLPLSFLLLAVPVTSLTALLPITVSGIGVRDTTWVVLLRLIDVPAGHALTTSLLYLLVFGIVGAIGGIWFTAAGTRALASTPSR